MTRLIQSTPFRFLLLLLPLSVLQLLSILGNVTNDISLDNKQVRSIRQISTKETTTSTIPKLKYNPLVLIFEGGCSGSTAVGRFINEIINAHGLQRYDRVGFEFMDARREFKNPFYFQLLNDTNYEHYTKDEMLMKSVAIAKHEADTLDQLFYFKAHIPKAENETLKRILDDIGVTFVGVYRENVIDRCICTTKDCFPAAAGYPVYKHNGTKAELCFNRRTQENAPPTVAYFKRPFKCLRTSFEQQKKIKRMDFPSVSEESLFEFEYTNDNAAFERSIDAWVAMMSPFLGETLDRNTLSEVLAKYQNSRALPSPHRDLIYNFNNFERITRNTQWAAYLRK